MFDFMIWIECVILWRPDPHFLLLSCSFVPPSDFEYTGDMSDDARRLHSLERKHYGYASSDGTLSVMETVPPCRPNIVPPIHFPGVGVVQGISRSCSVSSSRNSQGGRKKLHHRHSKNSIADSKKGFVPYRRQASGSRASMAESRRSMWDRPPTAMDTRSTLDSFCTEHRSGSSFQIPDDFDWTGDASDDCRRLEILERRQKKGDCVSSSSGLSFTDTMSEDMRMSPVPAMGFGVKKLTLPVSNNFARPPHSTTGKSRCVNANLSKQCIPAYTSCFSFGLNNCHYCQGVVQNSFRYGTRLMDKTSKTKVCDKFKVKVHLRF